MIAVDSSAFIAIIKNEPERDSFLAILKRADRVLVSPATIVEARMVAHRRGGPNLVAELDTLLATVAAEIEPIDDTDLAIAHDAFVAFGRGSGHPAKLNFGDLFSYALAKARGVPLLYKGRDFAHTDIVASPR
jgi:ribonuclease VapC